MTLLSFFIVISKLLKKIQNKNQTIAETKATIPKQTKTTEIINRKYFTNLVENLSADLLSTLIYPMNHSKSPNAIPKAIREIFNGLKSLKPYSLNCAAIATQKTKKPGLVPQSNNPLKNNLNPSK